jgi:hypothetical protein
VRCNSARGSYSMAGQHDPFACQRELLPNSDSTSPTVLVTGSRPCAGRWHKTKSRQRIRTGAEEEDLRTCGI